MSIIQTVYDAYRVKLLECGLTPEEADQVIDESRQLDEQLNNRTCPQCAKSIARVLDGNQAGVSLVQGSWFKYHCQHCGYIMCRIEPVTQGS